MKKLAGIFFSGYLLIAGASGVDVGAMAAPINQRNKDAFDFVSYRADALKVAASLAPNVPAPSDAAKNKALDKLRRHTKKWLPLILAAARNDDPFALALVSGSLSEGSLVFAASLTDKALVDEHENVWRYASKFFAPEGAPPGNPLLLEIWLKRQDGDLDAELTGANQACEALMPRELEKSALNGFLGSQFQLIRTLTAAASNDANKRCLNWLDKKRFAWLAVAMTDASAFVLAPRAGQDVLDLARPSVQGQAKLRDNPALLLTALGKTEFTSLSADKADAKRQMLEMAYLEPLRPYANDPKLAQEISALHQTVNANRAGLIKDDARMKLLLD